LAYAEFIFTPTPWPDFDKEQFRNALTEYAKRSRRFGGLSHE
jgi:undecaprenyl diphosphate synthase